MRFSSRQMKAQQVQRTELLLMLVKTIKHRDKLCLFLLLVVLMLLSLVLN